MARATIRSMIHLNILPPHLPCSVGSTALRPVPTLERIRSASTAKANASTRMARPPPAAPPRCRADYCLTSMHNRWDRQYLHRPGILIRFPPSRWITRPQRDICGPLARSDRGTRGDISTAACPGRRRSRNRATARPAGRQPVPRDRTGTPAAAQRPLAPSPRHRGRVRRGRRRRSRLSWRLGQGGGIEEGFDVKLSDRFTDIHTALRRRSARAMVRSPAPKGDGPVESSRAVPLRTTSTWLLCRREPSCVRCSRSCPRPPTGSRLPARSARSGRTVLRSSP